MWDDFNATVRNIDIDALGVAGLGDLAGRVGSTRAVLDGLEARIAVALRRLGASEASTAETLRRRTGCSTREAKHRAQRAETLQEMPNVAEALSAGRITGEHATALARAALETTPQAVDNDTGLLADAESVPADLASSKTRDWTRRQQTQDDLNRLHQWQRRNRSLSFNSGDGGMLNGLAKFDRVSGAQFQGLVEALADRLYRADGGRDNPHARTRAQCRLDALLALVGIEPAPPASGHAHGDGQAAEANNAKLPDQVGVPRGGPPSGRSRESRNGKLPGPLCPPGAAQLLAEPSGAAEDDESRRRDHRTGTDRSDSIGTARDEAAAADDGSSRPGHRQTPNGNALVLPGPGRPGGTPGSAVWPGCTCGRGLGVRGQLSIVLDVPYIASNGRQGRCEIPGIGEIARSELERRACDADLYGLIFSSDGLPLNHGRKTRTVSPQQWRVLVARDRGCVICGIRPDWCQAHHVKPWLRGGRTDIDNLALVCHTHHRWIHDNDIILRRDPNGWRAPPGVTVSRAPALTGH